MNFSTRTHAEHEEVFLVRVGLKYPTYLQKDDRFGNNDKIPYGAILIKSEIKYQLTK